MGCHSLKKKAEAGAAPSAAPRELTLADKIAATRAADRADAAAKKAEAEAAPSTAPRELTLAEAAKNEKSKRIKVRISG